MNTRTVSWEVPDDGKKYCIMEKEEHNRLIEDAFSFVCVSSSGTLTYEQVRGARAQAKQLMVICQRNGIVGG